MALGAWLGMAACGADDAGSTAGGGAAAGAASTGGAGGGTAGTGGVDTSLLPEDRATVWAPGVQGGVPERTTACATIDAGTYGDGTADATAGIQAALDACTEGQVVALSAGHFRIDDDILYVQKGITLRGAGAGQTFVQRTNGAVDTLDSVGVAMPVIIVGQSRWTFGEASTSLSADGAKGAASVTVASTADLSAGMLVLIDELSNG